MKIILFIVCGLCINSYAYERTICHFDINAHFEEKDQTYSSLYDYLIFDFNYETSPQKYVKVLYGYDGCWGSNEEELARQEFRKNMLEITSHGQINFSIYINEKHQLPPGYLTKFYGGELGLKGVEYSGKIEIDASMLTSDIINPDLRQKVQSNHLKCFVTESNIF